MVFRSNRKSYEMKDARITPENTSCINSKQDDTSSENEDIEEIESQKKKKTFLTMFASTFEKLALERIYQSFFSKRRRKTLLFLFICIVLFNIGLIIINAINYTDGANNILNRIIISSIAACISTLAFLCFACNLVDFENIRYLPTILWVIVFLQLQIDLLASTNTMQIYSLLGIYLFFVYITYTMITFRLYTCVILSIISTVSHTTSICASIKNFSNDHVPQVVGNVLLFVLSNILGIVNYIVVDANQRRAFLETREAYEVKLSFEKEEKNQRRLLQSILPPALATEVMTDMKADNSVLGDVVGFKKIYIQSYNKCSILFADIVGFTEYSSGVTAEELIIMLNELFANFDKFAKNHYCQRIKILGDCYYCISGIDIDGQTELSEKHAENTVEMGLEMVEHIKKVREEIKVSCLDMRVGIHSGHVLAGILGQRKWQFDVWSNDVTLANRMESGGIPGRVHISSDTHAYVRDIYEFEDGKGEDRNQFLKDNSIKTFLVRKRRKGESPMLASSNGNISQQPKHKNTSTGVSKLGKISNAFVAAKRLSHFEEPTKIQKESSDVESSCKDPEKKQEDTINHMLQEALNHRNSELKDVANIVTMRFINEKTESEYQQEKKTMSLVSLAGPFVLVLFSFLAKLSFKIVKDSTLAAFGSSILPITIIWLLGWSGRFSKSLPSAILRISDAIRTASITQDVFTSLCVILAIGGEMYDIAFIESNSRLPYGAYYTYIGILLLAVVANLIQLSYLLRITLLMLITAVYSALNYTLLKDQIPSSDGISRKIEIDMKLSLTIEFIFFFFILLFNSRVTEGTSRVLMLWKKEALDNKSGMENMRHLNERLMRNILPVHVIDHFLKMEHDDETALYSRSYKNVGVIFASIPNFSQFYSEEGVNKGGIECMRVLNEIISDFDEVLSDPRFHLIEKIKTVNSCYMAASGLVDQQHNSPDIINSDPWQHLVDLTDFALMLKEKLDAMNAESFNNFELRVGIANGPVVAGVIGAKKPHYDIWGNTVNISSRMESTGKSGCIQVLEGTYLILKDRGFNFEKRGYVNVKGKGQLLTYWCTGRTK